MTIEERATRYFRRVYKGEQYNIYLLLVEIATEQDRIARAEERERCIKIAQDTHCMFCSLFNKKSKECGLIDYPCTERYVIRKALEGGEE